jgi:NTP pyrophosphatase (non-canonical NTP hydrolase)
MIYAALIREWASARNLIKGSTPEKQFIKLMEEAGEVAAALARGKQDDLIDGLGDMFVVMTILAAQHGLHIEKCVSQAYSVIKDRKGRMQDGIFIKEDD